MPLPKKQGVPFKHVTIYGHPLKRDPLLFGHITKNMKVSSVLGAKYFQSDGTAIAMCSPNSCENVANPWGNVVQSL